MESLNQNEATWIMNPHGVKSCVPRFLAEKRVSTQVGWKYCEPEYVPEERAFPVTTELTEAGKARRNAINGSREANTVPLQEGETEADIREKAKELGIKSWHVKKVSTLVKEIQAL